MSKNDITGDDIKTKGVSKDYEDNFDRIFRNKSEADKPVERIKYCYTACKKPDCVCMPDWNEKRLDIIGQNGNNGEHYENSTT